ncbi:MAG: metallophosphoesterase family protein, partial [Bythopirellula sp.]
MRFQVGTRPVLIAFAVILACPRVQACDTCGCRREAEACTPHGNIDGGHIDGGHSEGGHGTMRFTPLSLGSPRAPAAGTSAAFRFGVLGDTQGLGFVSQLTADMNTQSLDLAVYPGDLVGTGGSASWDAWIADTSSANFDLYMVPGNHDLPVGGDTLWQSKFNWLPNSQTVGGVNGPQTGIDQMDYYFDVGDTRFISVTTDSQANGTRHPAAALPWFENVLNLPSTQSKDHVFVYTHHPITFDLYDGSGGIDGSFWQTMVDSGAPVHGIFEGHWHQYQPGRPDPYNQQLWEVIAGTGNAGFSGHPWQNKIGFTVIDVDGTEVTAEFFGDADNDGSYDDVLDAFTIASATPQATGLVVAYDFLDPATNSDTAH